MNSTACKYYTERTLGWMLNNKTIVFLSLLSFCLFVSTLALAGQRNRLTAEVDDLRHRLTTSSVLETTTPINVDTTTTTEGQTTTDSTITTTDAQTSTDSTITTTDSTTVETEPPVSERNNPVEENKENGVGKDDENLFPLVVKDKSLLQLMGYAA
uniref:A mucin-like protein with one putative transmembrane domain isoform1 n=1 Tax=Bombyx mori TaxID=7091 RepID=A0A2Z6G7Z4_BOMMO|nr:a mucin-like protein with one putative transmembrane domain isoform1 [Bombyx mori]